MNISKAETVIIPQNMSHMYMYTKMQISTNFAFVRDLFCVK